MWCQVHIKLEKGSCLNRVPYNSVIGFILVFIGGGVLCGTIYSAFSRVDNFFRLHFFAVESFHVLRIASVVNGAIVILLAIIVLIFSILVNNATRGRIYRGDRFILGGRSTAALFMCITYVTIIVWLLFLVFLVIPTFCWMMFSSICTAELADVWSGPGARRPGPDTRVAPSLSELKDRRDFFEKTYEARLANYYHQNYHEHKGSSAFMMPQADVDFHLQLGQSVPISNRLRTRLFSPDFNYVFNLTHYGIYIHPWRYQEPLLYREAIVTLQDFSRFCDEVTIVGPLFLCSLLGALFVLLGLTLFIGSLSGYYTRLKLTKELTDFKQSVALRSPKNHNDYKAHF